MENQERKGYQFLLPIKKRKYQLVTDVEIDNHMFDEDEIFDLNLHFVTAINKGKESITTDGEDKDKNPSIIAINKDKDKVVDESSPIVTMNKGKDTILDESSITIARDKHKANTSYLSHPMVKVDDISVVIFLIYY